MCVLLLISGRTSSNLWLGSFQLEVHLKGQEISSEYFWKTLVYAYAYASYEWEQRSDRQRTVFAPTNVQGLQLRVVSLAGRPISKASLLFLIPQLGITIDQFGKYETIRGQVRGQNGRPFLNFYLDRQSPRNTVAGTMTNPTQTFNKTPVVKQTLFERGRSPYSFDRSLFILPQPKGRLDTSKSEGELMVVLLDLASLAWQEAAFPIYVASGETFAAAASPADGMVAISGREVLDTLVDVADWEYREKSRLGSFQYVNASINRRSSGQGPTRKVGEFNLWYTE